MNYEKLPKTISAEELLSTPLPPVKWIIPDLLPAGLAPVSYTHLTLPTIA